MILGVEVLFEKRLDLIRGRRVGLITNPTGVDRAYRGIIERFRSEPNVDLVALYGPEHGVRGNAQAGEYVNVMSHGIIDPTKVVRAALQGAASVAGLLITTEAMVADLPQKKDQAMPGGNGVGGMGY